MTENFQEEINRLLTSEGLGLIEAKMNQFNIFRTLKLSNQELKHSRFIAWLLNPNETHSLKDYPLKEFLRTIPLSDTVGRWDNLDLTDTDVYLEVDNIDVLLVNYSHQFVCVLENKIWTTNHDQQLTRYKDIVDRKYPDYKKFFLYLTPMGDHPQNDAAADKYVCISYESHVYPLVQKILARVKSNAEKDVSLFIEHYKTMIEEDIMDNKQLRELCIKTYREHKAALDKIFENMPDLQMLISDALQQIIKEQGYELDVCNKKYIRFYPAKFEKYSFFKKGQEWTNTNNILLFEFRNSADKLTCHLLIGPSNDDELRKTLYRVAEEQGVHKSALTGKWTTIYQWNFKTDNLSMKEEDKIYPRLQGQFLKYKPDIDRVIEALCKGFDGLTDKNF